MSPFVCERCGASRRSKSELMLHLARQFSCSPKESSIPSYVLWLRLQFDNQLRFVCEFKYCLASFKKRNHLQMHSTVCKMDPEKKIYRKSLCESKLVFTNCIGEEDYSAITENEMQVFYNTCDTIGVLKWIYFDTSVVENLIFFLWRGNLFTKAFAKYGHTMG